MAKTATFTTDNVGNPEAVTAPISCRRITIREQGAAGTTDYLVHAPSATDAAYRKVAGESTTFEPPPGQMIQASEVVGYTETITGTITMSMICE